MKSLEIFIIAAAAVVLTIVTGANTTTTVSVSNERRPGLASSPIYVTCYEGLGQQPPQTILPGHEVPFQLKTPADGLGCFCVGRFSELDEMGKPRYYIYDSRHGSSNYGGYGNCESSVVCPVKANDTSFYGWNQGKREWDIIMPKIWLP
ncbi:unnamed protein product [Linum trigynum]|uniref:Uncharacterized protein n=1 Tax=Linum trigynum TaxID=586398 RepID=A0AAV2G5T1_9ROSI